MVENIGNEWKFLLEFIQIWCEILNVTDFRLSRPKYSIEIQTYP